MGRLASVRRLTRVHDDPSAGFPARLFRLSYNSATDTYTHDLGFPVAINDYKTETLVIDKDSKGVLWATWAQGATVYVSHTVGGDSAWATPFALPAARAGGLTADDISSLIAFGGDKIGVMWSNQQTSEMLFAVHQDGDAPTNWHATETALGGANNADDSINLKTDQFGFVFAVTQTQRTDPTAPSNYLSIRVPGGLWTHWVVARKADGVGQPIVLLDEHNRSIHVYLASTGTFGTIHHKVTPMILPSFAAGPGTPVIRSGLPGGMTAPTSTKQNVGINSGIAVQSVHSTAEEYWHNSAQLAGDRGAGARRRVLGRPDHGWRSVRRPAARPVERRADVLDVVLRRRRNEPRGTPSTPTGRRAPLR